MPSDRRSTGLEEPNRPEALLKAARDWLRDAAALQHQTHQADRGRRHWTACESERASCDVAKLERRRGDQNFKGYRPDAGAARNADPNYGQEDKQQSRDKDEHLVP